MYDATNIRLRELSLGYNFPRTMLAKTPFTSARLSFVARNLFMIYSKTKDSTRRLLIHLVTPKVSSTVLCLL